MSKSYKGSGVGVKKMKKFPLILKYLEAFHKDIFDLFDDLGMEGSLIPKKFGGITFLLPSKNYVSKIRKIIESDNPEEATDMLLSLIIPDYLDSGAAWAEKQDDIPNLLGKKIIVKGISGNKVSVDDGELVLDPDFRGFERSGNRKRGNLAVWELKGEIEYQKAPASTFKYLKRSSSENKKPKKTGKGEENLRIESFIKETLNKEVDAIKSGEKDSQGKFISPIMIANARIIRGLESDNELYLAARCILTKCPIIDFYLLTKASDIFPPDKILEAYKTGGPDNNKNVETIKELFGGKIDSDAAIINDFDKLKESREIVKDLISKTGNSGATNINEVYKNLDEHNKLQFKSNTYIENVYPEYIANIFSNNSGIHLAIDEAKQFLHSAIQRIKKSVPGSEEWDNNRKTRAMEYENLFKDINDCFGKIGDPNKTIINLPIQDKNDNLIFNDFYDEFFLHFPAPTGNFEHLEEREIYGGAEEEDFYESEYLDSAFESELENYCNEEMRLSNSTINELKSYMKSNGGRFPDL